MDSVEFYLIVAVAIAVAIALVALRRSPARRRGAEGGSDRGQRPDASSPSAESPTASVPATPARQPPAVPSAGVARSRAQVVRVTYEEDIEAEVTRVTLNESRDDLVDLSSIDKDLDDEEEGGTAEPQAVPIVFDEDAAVDEPTHAGALILVSAAGQSDQGRRRRRNEDSYTMMHDQSVFIVADGMGGYAGGDIASQTATEVISGAFQSKSFPGRPYESIPRNASELALSIQAANAAIYEKASADSSLTGMGTTVVAARFSPNKQRLYVGHVGDSRCYRLRDDTLVQMTTDHTMAAHGYKGREAAFLTRAIGIAPTVTIDMIIAKPKPEDIYLLCSDGLSKMATDVDIRDILATSKDLEQAVVALVDRANGGGGKDNITVVLVAVRQPLSVPPS